MHFFTSDHHFDHFNIIALVNRPFISVEEMNEYMIAAWNRRVGKKDIVYHLGDLCFKLETAERILPRLNGIFCVVPGNHDHWFSRTSSFVYSDILHTTIFLPIHELKIDKQRIVLCHYPLREWNGFYRGAIHLHGHVHNSLQSSPRTFDVGVDTHKSMEPYSLEEILEKMK